jgi:hypothetical protein
VHNTADSNLFSLTSTEGVGCPCINVLDRSQLKIIYYYIEKQQMYIGKYFVNVNLQVKSSINGVYLMF